MTLSSLTAQQSPSMTVAGPLVSASNRSVSASSVRLSSSPMSCVPMGAAALEVEKIIDGEIAGITSLWEMLQKNLPCHIIQNNADLPPQRVFGNYEGNVVWSGSNFLRRFNLKLAQVVISGVTIFDLDMVSSVYGKKRWHDARYWYHSKHAFTLDAIGFVAFELSKQIVAIKGLAKKCIVLDLDNTLWGGVVGDDGLDGIVLGNGANGEALVDFQKYLLGLKNRGIILAVSSKNDEKIAKEPFLKHPDMQLKLEDIAVFSANWENKVDNIRKIAATLNLGLDSIVFVDDNPAERLLVRSLLPLVSVPEMPEDPTEFINMLNRHSYFETVSFSEEDKQRSDYYRQNASRNEFQKKHENISEYLKSLGMSATIGKFDKFNLPRIVQLINKSNQFHLTATRYLENEILALMEKNNIMGLYFKLKDRFGDNGLISVLILEKTRDDNLFINTWVMSCRVLMRGLEEFINEEIISLAKSLSCKKIIGKYTPTNKNKLVADLYRRLHFEFLKEEAGVTFWALDLEKERPKCQTFISKAEN